MSKMPSARTVADKVSAVADTIGTKINVAETKRVLACHQQVLIELFPDPVERLQYLIKNYVTVK